jgi:hypothetical protein
MYEYRLGTTAGFQEVFSNATLATSGAKPSFGNSWPTTPVSYRVGGTGGSVAFDGNIADLFVYNRTLTDYERQLTEGYSAWKWGLQSNLPSDHPYRNTQPLNPGLISPYEAPNLSFWLDATRIAAVSSGTALTQWNDVSSNAFVGTTANGPVYQSSIFNGYMPAVTFNGTNQSVRFGCNLPLRTSSLSVFAAYLTSNNNGTIIARSDTTGQQRWGLLNETHFGGVGNYLFVNATGTDVVTGTTNSLNTPNLVNANWNRSQVTFLRNGTLNASNTFVNSTDFNTNYVLEVGSYANNSLPVLNLSGYIGEILVYLSTPIESTRQKIEGYLSWKWGLTQNLPGNHPYKFYPPLSNYSSIAINTSTVFATNFNAGNDIGFTNFSNTQLISSTTITGAGSAYNTIYTGSTNIYPSKTFTSFSNNYITWCADIYRTGSGDNSGIIFTRGGCNGSLSLTMGMNLYSTTNRLGYVWIGGADSSTAYDTGAAGFIPLCNWTHVAVAVSPTETRFYINGSNIATRTCNATVCGFNEMTIGSDLITPATRYFPGYIDNVRFYASTLTSNEIQAIYYNTQFV